MNQNRYEKEIEEILKKAGEKPAEQAAQEPGGQARRRRISLRSVRFNFKTALLAGIVLLLLAVVISAAELYLFLAGVALLVVGYVMYYRAPRYGGGGGSGGDSPGPKMWRGRPIDPDNDPHFTNDHWGRGR